MGIIACKSTALLAAMVLPSVRWATYFTLWMSTVKGDNLVFLSELSKSTTFSGIFEKSIDLNSKWVLCPGCRVHANSSIIPFCNPNLSVLWFILRFSSQGSLTCVLLLSQLLINLLCLFCVLILFSYMNYGYWYLCNFIHQKIIISFFIAYVH